MTPITGDRRKIKTSLDWVRDNLQILLVLSAVVGYVIKSQNLLGTLKDKVETIETKQVPMIGENKERITRLEDHLDSFAQNQIRQEKKIDWMIQNMTRDSSRNR